MLKKFLAIPVLLYTALAMAAVDVNKASEADLDGIRGIGPATSKLIMAERKKAPFKNWEDFTSRVKGIGESRAAKLSEDGLRINGSAFKGATAAKADGQGSAADAKKPAVEAKAAAPAPKSSGADAKPTHATPGVVAAPVRADAGTAKK